MAQADEVGAAHAAASSPVLFGTILFLASEFMLFGGLFAAYFGLRSETTPWPPEGILPDVRLAAMGTAMLVLSSFALARGLDRGARGQLNLLRRWTLVAMALGVGFLGLEVWDWTHVAFAISSQPYGTMYFTLTGIHGLHVLAGLVVLSVLIARSHQGAYSQGKLTGAHAMAYYWQFCDATWILIFLVVFVLR
jgi:cytochrome c oxidase subunit 3